MNIQVGTKFIWKKNPEQTIEVKNINLSITNNGWEVSKEETIVTLIDKEKGCSTNYNRQAKLKDFLYWLLDKPDEIIQPK